MKLLGFIKSDIEIYIPIEKIKGIFKDEAVFRYPELSYKIFGIMFINGEVVPVIDPFQLFLNRNKSSSVFEYNTKCSVIITESSNGMIGFIYDYIKDIFERDEITDICPLNIENIPYEDNKVAFLVENIEIIEDIISSIRLDTKSFKEIILCPEES